MWLIGGGAMGEEIRAKDWSSTPLGALETWPASLRTTLSVALNSTFPIAIVWGPGHCQIYNDGYWPICGPKHPASMGQDFRECWASAFPVIGDAYASALAGKAKFLENQRIFVDRLGFLEETFFTFSFSPIYDERGTVAGLFHPVTEVTAKMLSERRVRTLRDLSARTGKARNVDEACALASDTLADYDLDVPFVLFYVVNADRSRLERIGTTGLSGATWVSPEWIARTDGSACAVWSVLDSQQPERIDELPARLNGFAAGPYPEPPLSAYVLPIRPSGVAQSIGVVVAGVSSRLVLDGPYRDFYQDLANGVSNAVTNARAYEHERKRAEALAEIDRAKTAFFSNVSHEFRTPLTLMLGPTEDALSSIDGVLRGSDLETVHRNELRLLKLVNALLDFSRIEAGRVQASYEPTDLAALTTDLASAFRSAVERAGLKLIVRVNRPMPSVYVDREMWEKIVLNLISNALKFTFDGEIEVELEASGEYVALSVRDTGIGISKEELPRVFERFHRVEGVRARTYEGSGIGLALVWELARMHGGDVRVESEPGTGTRFVVRIPLGCEHLPKDRIRADRTAASTATGAEAFVGEALRWIPSPVESADPTLREAQRGARILLADDNADMREYLARILGERWTVVTVADGLSALDAVRREPFDLVLTDVMMPGLDGFGLLRALRENEETAELPVIMLSARAGEEARVEGLRAGADDYLIKPFSAREVVARISTQLRLAAARREAEIQWEKLLALFEQAPMPIAWIVSPELRYEFVNEAHRKLWGRDLTGTAMEQSSHESSMRRDLVESALRGVVPVLLECLPIEARDATGTSEVRYHDVLLQPVRDGAGAVRGALIIGSDVTERTLAEQHRERIIALERAARADADAANRAKDDFLAMLGHELRNPLSPIVTALEVLRLKGNWHSEHELIQRQVQHLIRLVDDLLDVHRITHGKIELQKRPVEIAEVVARAVEIAAPIVEERRHRLIIDVPRRALTIDADPSRMSQVVSNLLVNAAKYSDPSRQIWIAAARNGASIRLSVRDEGDGMDPDMLRRVFDLFVQQPQTIERAKGGIGLGLAIVRSLVELHGGTVSARSDGRGTGSTFTIELPASNRDAELPRRAPSVLRSDSGSAKRVLVVDDNVDAADVLAIALQSIGFVVKVAHDGPGAIDAVNDFEPDVVLLDIGLPLMNGYEVAERLRTRTADGSLQLVAVTGYGQDADRARSMDAGFARHLVKPVALEQLERVVQELVR